MVGPGACDHPCTGSVRADGEEQSASQNKKQRLQKAHMTGAHLAQNPALQFSQSGAGAWLCPLPAVPRPGIKPAWASWPQSAENQVGSCCADPGRRKAGKYEVSILIHRGLVAQMRPTNTKLLRAPQQGAETAKLPSPDLGSCLVLLAPSFTFFFSSPVINRREIQSLHTCVSPHITAQAYSTSWTQSIVTAPGSKDGVSLCPKSASGDEKPFCENCKLADLGN